ncbi:hypothetical protein [Streptomyces showdoensis]|uniref:hypothetical protein n=1 Tax=Streptomyces showdoensis TaxID=68268 RepID=UPI0031EBDE1B
MIARLSYRAWFWRNTTAINYELAPAWLPWSAVDPDRIAFAWDEAEASEITTVIASMVPPDDAGWEDKHRFTTEVTALLAARYGRWTCGWHWAVGEGGGGGVVTHWCCTSHSMGGPAATAAKVVASLLEWRDWLEELAERFERLAPSSGANAEDRSWHLERAAIRLVTVVMDRTGAECGWYGLKRPRPGPRPSRTTPSDGRPSFSPRTPPRAVICPGGGGDHARGRWGGL